MKHIKRVGAALLLASLILPIYNTARAQQVELLPASHNACVETTKHDVWVLEGKKVNGYKHHDGAWKQAEGWHVVPQAVLDAANFDPRNVSQSGNVNLSAYGGPNVSVPYQITGIEEQTVPHGAGSPWGGAGVLVETYTVNTPITTGDCAPCPYPGDAQHVGDDNCTPPVPRTVTFTHDDECGTYWVKVNVSESVPASWWYGVRVAVDGTIVGSAIRQGPGTNTFNGTLDEDQGDGQVTIAYWVHASTEQDLLPGDLKPVGTPRSFTVDTDCEPNEVPTTSTEPDAPEETIPDDTPTTSVVTTTTAPGTTTTTTTVPPVTAPPSVPDSTVPADDGDDEPSELPTEQISWQLPATR